MVSIKQENYSRLYDDVVKAIRVCTFCIDGCDKCPYQSKSRCYDNLMRDALHLLEAAYGKDTLDTAENKPDLAAIKEEENNQ